MLPPLSLRSQLAAGVAALRSEALREVPVENLHVTVEFLGDVTEADIAPLTAALRGVATGLPAFSLRVIGTQPAPKRRPRMLWAVTERSEPLGSLAHAVNDAAAPFAPGRGRPAGERGHITLARYRGRVVGLELRALDAEFAVEEVVLMRSRLSPAGATYEVVAAMPLGT